LAVADTLLPDNTPQFLQRQTTAFVCRKGKGAKPPPRVVHTQRSYTLFDFCHCASTMIFSHSGFYCRNNERQVPVSHRNIFFAVTCHFIKYFATKIETFLTFAKVLVFFAYDL
jgi:hypothetical protein